MQEAPQILGWFVNRVDLNSHSLTPLNLAMMQNDLLIEILTKLKVLRKMHE